MSILSSSIRRALAVGLTLLVGLTAAAPGAAQTGSTYFITNVDASAFPRVQFKVRALDQDNHAIGTLTAANLAIYEDGQQVPVNAVQVTPQDDGPLQVVFVVDQGAQSNYAPVLAALRESISRLVDGRFFVDERDAVRLVVRENPGTGDRTTSKIGPTHNGRELLDFIASYTFPRSVGRTKGLEGVNDALNGMSQMVAEPGVQDAAVVFISRAIEDPAAKVAVTGAQNSATDAKQRYVTLYAMQMSGGTADQVPLQVLGQGSGGIFVNVRPNAVSAAVDIVYRALSAQRRYYTVSYVSPSTATGTRLITVGSPQKPATGKTGQYSVSISPPHVTLALGSKQLLRNPLPGITDVARAYSPLKVKVDVTVGWSDVVTRALRSVELAVNGVKQDERGVAQLPAGTTSIPMEVDLSSITTPGLNTAVVSVRVVDDLGSEASAQENVSIDVAPIPTPVPTKEPGTSDNPAILIGAVLVALVAVALAVFFFMRQRRGGSTPPLMKKPDAPLATLIVMQGPPAMVNQPVYMTRPSVVLGRDPVATDIAFYAGETSSVGRKHAIIAADGRGGFSITDNGSANGTRVNNKRLNAGMAEALRDGDEIVLGDLRNRGVKIRFALKDGGHWLNRDNVTHVLQ